MKFNKIQTERLILWGHVNRNCKPLNEVHRSREYGGGRRRAIQGEAHKHFIMRRTCSFLSLSFSTSFSPISPDILDNFVLCASPLRIDFQLMTVKNPFFPIFFIT